MNPAGKQAGIDIGTAVDLLFNAEATRTPQASLTASWHEFDVDTAYAIQDEALQRRRQRGEQVVGIKLGLTSRAKQQRMGISTPVTAWLTDRMALSAEVPVPYHELIHPRAEPELIFLMGRRLAGPGVTAATALAAVGRVFGGIEIIDSRYEDFHFTLPDAIADNASSAKFVVGGVGRSPEALDLGLEACLVEVDGQVIDTATGAAVQGHPAEALALAANELGARGHAIEPGWLVLTGGMTDAVTLRPGTSCVTAFTHLGTVAVGG